MAKISEHVIAPALETTRSAAAYAKSKAGKNLHRVRAISAPNNKNRYLQFKMKNMHILMNIQVIKFCLYSFLMCVHSFSLYT